MAIWVLLVGVARGRYIHNTVNSLFFVLEIFSDAHVVRKFVTRILFHNENFSPTKYYLIRIFRTKMRTRE